MDSIAIDESETPCAEAAQRLVRIREARTRRFSAGDFLKPHHHNYLPAMADRARGYGVLLAVDRTGRVAGRVEMPGSEGHDYTAHDHRCVLTNMFTEL